MAMIFIPVVAGCTLGMMAAKAIDKQSTSTSPRRVAKSERIPSASRMVNSMINTVAAIPAEAIQSTSRLVNGTINTVEKITQKSSTLLFKDIRKKHLQEMSLDEDTLSEEQKMANRHFKRSCMIFASMGTCLLVYPPLIMLHVPFFVYIGYPFYKKTLSDFFIKRKVTTDVVDSAIGLGSMGYTPFNPNLLFFGATSGIIRSYTFKITAATKDGTRKNLTNLMGEQPQLVWILRGGVEVEVPFESIERDDVLVINAGQMIPVDGIIEEGIVSVDQHLLTGESQPAEKSVGDVVLAATVILSGKAFIRVEKTGEETAAAQIGQMLMQTADFTSSIELRGLEISDQMALPTLLLGGLSLPFLGVPGALTVLISGFGYNMRLLGPLSVLNYLQLMAQEGILIKDGRALEQISKVDTVVFDKTGTLTLEQPHVGAIHTCNGHDERSLLTYAAAAEHRQSHPIAKAILQAAKEQGLTLPAIDQASYEIGYGIKVRLNDTRLHVGSNRFMDMEAIAIPDKIQALAQSAQDQGHSMVYVAINKQLAGAIELHPTVRPEAKRIIDGLRQRGLELVIISGDHERATRALAQQLGIDNYFAETLPENKADLITQLQDEGKFVCFVGDGINDSIALKKAQVSISLRGATTVATDTAQIILMDESLNQLEKLFTISAEFERNMQTNLMTTIVPGVVIISGAFLGVVGYGSAIGLFWVGGITGIVNAMRPLFSRRKKSGHQIGVSNE